MVSRISSINSTKLFKSKWSNGPTLPILPSKMAQLFFTHFLPKLSVFRWVFSFDFSTLTWGSAKLSISPKQETTLNNQKSPPPTPPSPILYIPFCVMGRFILWMAKHPSTNKPKSQERQDRVEEFLKLHSFTDVNTPKRVQERPCSQGIVECTSTKVPVWEIPI